MAINVGSFVSAIVGATVCLIVVAAVALPVIGGLSWGEGDNATMMATIVNIIPVLMIVAILLLVIGLFVYKRR